MHQRSVIANAKYQPASNKAGMKKLIKYYQYRDEKNEHIPQQDEQGRATRQWIDLGLGKHYSQIMNQLEHEETDDLKKAIGMRTLVIAPEIDLMQAIEPDRQEQVLAELTIATVEQFFEDADLPAPHYSLILHHGAVSETRPNGEEIDEDLKRGDMPYLHAHVVLSPTLAGKDYEKESYFLCRDEAAANRSKQRNPLALTNLHEAARENMEHIWERELGRERVQQLNQDLEEKVEDLQRRDRDREEERIREGLPDPSQLEAILRENLGLEVEPEIEIEGEDIASGRSLDFDRSIR